jgi:hypothetical protein
MDMAELISKLSKGNAVGHVYFRVLPLSMGGGVNLGGKEASRDGRSDKISGSAPPENHVRRVFD